MVVPSASFVAAARDSLKDDMYQQMNYVALAAQKREYMGEFPQASEAEYEAYAIGVEVCRILLLGMPNAVKNHVQL